MSTDLIKVIYQNFYKWWFLCIKLTYFIYKTNIAVKINYYKKRNDKSVFNTETNLGNIEPFKLLPDVLQNYISDYIEEAYNQKCFNYDWYDTIETIGYYYGYDYLFDLLNKYMTIRIIGPLQIIDCKNMTGYCHRCYKFITCDEKREVGFYYDYLQMPDGEKIYMGGRHDR